MSLLSNRQYSCKVILPIVNYIIIWYFIGRLFFGEEVCFYMADANLLSVIKQRGKRNALEDIVIFGKIRCAIKEPEILSGLEVKGGVYAIIDAFAFKCLGENYFGKDGYSDINRIYFTRGSIIICIDSLDWVGKTVKVYGASTRKGVKIKQNLNASATEGVIALQFIYDSGNFIVVPNKLVEIGKIDNDIRGTVLEDFMATVVMGNEVEYPKTLDSIVEYSGVSEYEEITKDVKLANTFKYSNSNEMIDVTKLDMKLVYHTNGAEKSELFEDFQEEIEAQGNARKKYCNDIVKNLKEIYDDEAKSDFDYASIGYKGSGNLLDVFEIASDIKKKFIENIASRFGTTIGSSKTRGYVYVNQFLDELRNGNICQFGDKEEKYAAKEIADTLYGMVELDSSVLYGIEYKNVELLRDPVSFSIAVVSICCGLDIESVAYNMRWCDRTYTIGRNFWFYLLIRFPYLLGMLGSGLSLVECDIIYFSFNRYYSKGCLSDMNMDMRCKMLFLESLNNASDRDSLISKETLKASTNGYPKRASSYLDQYGFPARGDITEVLKVLLHPGLAMSRVESERLKNTVWYSDERVEELIEVGLVNTIDDLLILESDLEKEFLIYRVLINKGNSLTGLNDDTIDNVIENFEQEKGFRLESLQKDGIHLTKFRAAVLSGCAGSGKTTTSDCMVEALKCLPNFDKEYELVYCTPTGKACRRLAEVVRGTVKTIHSQFGIGLGNSSYMSSVGMKYVNREKVKIYLMDEMAMCSMPLLYEICRNLSSDDIIYFLGDIKQLSPIGKGNPFALLMKLLPCIELGVSKRAAEGSLINYNTALVNCASDGLVRELSYNNKDFFKVECDDALIPMKVSGVWKAFMDGSMNGKKYSEDDIQVITGYQKEDIVFSAPQLNTPIQKLLRKNDKLLFMHTNREFYNNDRVIHVKLNSYSMQRYIEESPNSFVPVVTFGIVNGEVGKLEGIVRSDMCTVYDFSYGRCVAGIGHYDKVSEEELDELIKKREEREDGLRDDTKFKNNRFYFVKVKVYDVELQKDVYVLYQASSIVRDGVTVLEGSDLSCLDLAYALTTHKMQGSQSPVVICTFGSRCNPRFINRNMINTMFTRSQEVVCNVGTVVGSESPITEGRKYISPVTCSDALSILVGE